MCSPGYSVRDISLVCILRSEMTAAPVGTSPVQNPEPSVNQPDDGQTSMKKNAPRSGFAPP